MVSAVVAWEQSRRVTRVPQNRVELYYAVEFAATEDPSVDLLSYAFFLRSVEVTGGFKSRNEFSNGGLVVPIIRIPL
jgi:hypothetical protein